MVVVRSVSTRTLIDCGSVALNWGRRCSMLSTTAMMLAPGWRWILTITAGVVFIQAACRSFSAPSTTLATSEKRIAAPLR